MTFVVTVLLGFLIIVLAIGAMGIGVMNGREPIKGSCGGVGAGGCELCRGDCRDREGRTRAADAGGPQVREQNAR